MILYPKEFEWYYILHHYVSVVAFYCCAVKKFFFNLFFKLLRFLKSIIIGTWRFSIYCSITLIKRSINYIHKHTLDYFNIKNEKQFNVYLNYNNFNNSVFFGQNNYNRAQLDDIF